MKTGSVDLPDEIEKSLSSASTSPCPSPVRQNQKSHRLLPTNLYVVLYNFKSRHQDELDLKAGYKVTVIDTSDPDWWKGKCLGKVGYFPSKYCTKLAASEKPLQVTHNLQVTDNERGDGTLTLLRDQIVIQVGEELNGMVMVRSADNRQGVCPVKYLQEHTGTGKSTTATAKSSRKDTERGGTGSARADRDQKDQCHAGGHHYHRESRNNFHKSYDRSWEKWEKFREKKMEMMKAHKYNVEHRLKYDNQERILYRHHFNYYPVKRPRPRKTSLEPNWYTENIYSNQSIDNSDGELGVGFPGSAAAGGLRDINGNMSMGGGLGEDDGIFTIDGQFGRRNHYPKSSSCCFGVNRMRDIDEAGDGLELGADGWNERYPKIPKSYSFSTSRNMGVGFNMAKLYNRNSFEMPEFPSRERRRQGALSDPEGRAIYVMEEDFDLFDEDDDDDDEVESELTTLYADDRHSIAYGDYGGVARQLYGHPRSTIGDHVDDLYQAERSKQLLRSKLDRVTKYTDEFTDDYRKSFEDFFNQNCCIERHHQQLKDSGRFFQKAPVATKNKSMLEVKPPSRFDDSSSGSTDLELDDFNFDFEKYWEELEKPSPTSPSELEERKRLNRGGETGAGGTGAGKKVKNVNLSRCYNNGTVIDIYHDDDPYHRDHYHYREGGHHHGDGGGCGGKVANNHHRHHHHLNYNPHQQHSLPQQQQQQQQHHANTTPRSRGATRHKVYPSEGPFDSPRALGNEQEEEEQGRVSVRRGGPKSNATDKPMLDGSGNAIAGNSNAISFLNNIFSIYKPNKYSPLNCHGEQNYLKNIPAKKMNIVASSAARPLGAGTQAPSGGGGDGSSTKRPLTVHPAAKPSVASVASAARRSTRPGPPAGSGKDPQARFQIIPDKTGVKISPLYRLDAQDYRRARYKLKSTSRPLSFW
uniref:Uncharacterized protein n=1 Tax=Anopheles atroparvus TaxID=41427 RepID=A0A182J7P1_ANOAO